MNSEKTQRDLRWEKIQNMVTVGRSKMPEHMADSWVVVIPSADPGKNILMSLPFFRELESFDAMMENRKAWYEEVTSELDEQDKIDAMYTAVVPFLENKAHTLDIKLIPNMVWYFIQFFLHQDNDFSAVEIFEEHKVIFVDFQPVKIPLTGAAMEAGGHSTTIH